MYRKCLQRATNSCIVLYGRRDIHVVSKTKMRCRAIMRPYFTEFGRQPGTSQAASGKAGGCIPQHHITSRHIPSIHPILSTCCRLDYCIVLYRLLIDFIGGTARQHTYTYIQQYCRFQFLEEEPQMLSPTVGVPMPSQYSPTVTPTLKSPMTSTAAQHDIVSLWPSSLASSLGFLLS